MQKIFQLGPFSPGELLVIISVSLIPVTVIEVLKLVRSFSRE